MNDWMYQLFIVEDSRLDWWEGLIHALLMKREAKPEIRKFVDQQKTSVFSFMC